MQRIDTRTNAVVQQLRQDAATVSVDGVDAVWVTNDIGDVVRLRPAAETK